MKINNTATLQKHGLKLVIGILRLFLFTTLAFVVIYPILTRIAASFMSVSDVFNNSVQYIPKDFTFDNYINIWKDLNLSSAIPVTVQYTILTAILQVASATVVGYGLARFKFKLNTPLLMMALVSMAIPPTLQLIPLYKIFANFGIANFSANILNSQWCMIILSITATGYRCGLYILLMRQYFKGVPKELEEAAYIDGAGNFRTFFSIMLPSAKTMMITIGLFAFVWIWLDSDYAPTLMYDMPLLVNRTDMISSVLFAKTNSETLIGLYSNTAVVIMIIPLVILYLFTQKYFVQSIERSGLVG